MDTSLWQTTSSFDILYSPHAWLITDKIVMWVIQLNTADWVFAKTLILLVTLKTQNQPQGESYVCSEVEHVFP